MDQKPWPSLDGESDERARPGPGASHKTPDILLFETGLWNSRYGPRTLTPNDPRPKDQPDLFRRTLDVHVVAYTQELERSFRGLKIWAGAPVCCNQFKHYAKRVSIDWARRFNAAAENNAHLNEHSVFWDRQVTSDVLSLRHCRRRRARRSRAAARGSAAPRLHAGDIPSWEKSCRFKWTRFSELSALAMTQRRGGGKVVK